MQNGMERYIHSRLGPFNRSLGSCNADMDEIHIFKGEWR